MTAASAIVVGLLLEDDERRDDVEARVDHGRELAREDLERAQLDLLLLRLLGSDGAQLGESDGTQSSLAQELPRGVQVRCSDLPGRLGPESIDRAIGERRHTLSRIGTLRAALEEARSRRRRSTRRAPTCPSSRSGERPRSPA